MQPDEVRRFLDAFRFPSNIMWCDFVKLSNEEQDILWEEELERRKNAA